MRIVLEARASTILFKLASALGEHAVQLLPTNICPVVPLALIAAERQFEFIDLDAVSLCMSPDLVWQRLQDPRQPAVAAVVYVRTYGYLDDQSAFFRKLRSLSGDLLIIDDRCLCRPVLDPNELDRQGADVVVFSTGYCKPTDLGFGGFAYLAEGTGYEERSAGYRRGDLDRVTSLYKRHIRNRQPLYNGDAGSVPPESLRQLQWLDSRRPEIAWPEYRDRVRHTLAESERQRALINDIYRTRMPGSVQLPDGYHGWRFQIRVTERDSLLRKIFAAGLFASDHYFPAATLFGGRPCQMATMLYTCIINLFNDFNVSERDATRLADMVGRHAEQTRKCRVGGE